MSKIRVYTPLESTVSCESSIPSCLFPSVRVSVPGMTFESLSPQRTVVVSEGQKSKWGQFSYSIEKEKRRPGSKKWIKVGLKQSLVTLYKLQSILTTNLCLVRSVLGLGTSLFTVRRLRRSTWMSKRLRMTPVLHYFRVSIPLPQLYQDLRTSLPSIG